MPITTRELITRSWYLSGIVSRDLQTVSGEQLSDGLNLLNSLLAFKTVDERKIPYYSLYQFNAIVGQEKYFIPGLISCETLTFTIGSVRYGMEPKERKAYFATPRANNVLSLPFCYHLERVQNGSDLYMYFLPNSDYPFEMYGNFSLANVTIDQDLELSLDDFYIEYLRYLLASYMCDFYEVTLPASVEKRLKSYEDLLIDVSPIDFSLQKRSTLMAKRRPGFYGMANIGVGYVP